MKNLPTFEEFLLDKNSIKIDYNKSRFDKTKLPNKFKYIKDDKTTNFKISSSRNLFSFQFHTHNTWAIISW